MPTTKPGQEMVNNYLKENNIKISDLAKMYGMTKSEVSMYLSGKRTSSTANKFILKVIQDFKI